MEESGRVKNGRRTPSFTISPKRVNTVLIQKIDDFAVQVNLSLEELELFRSVLENYSNNASFFSEAGLSDATKHKGVQAGVYATQIAHFQFFTYAVGEEG